MKFNAVLQKVISFAVAPFVGAWIEIFDTCIIYELSTKSLPSWERGLKLAKSPVILVVCAVAPFVGAWIEI